MKSVFIAVVVFTLLGLMGCSTVPRDALNVRTFGAVGNGAS